MLNILGGEAVFVWPGCLSTCVDVLLSAGGGMPQACNRVWTIPLQGFLFPW